MFLVPALEVALRETTRWQLLGISPGQGMERAGVE